MAAPHFKPSHTAINACYDQIAGFRMHECSLPLNDCPYLKGDYRRSEWMSGWLDAHTKHSLGHILDGFPGHTAHRNVG